MSKICFKHDLKLVTRNLSVGNSRVNTVGIITKVGSVLR